MEEFAHSPVTYGPFIEETMLSAGLDYYKPTMSQLQYEKYPDAEVTFTFKNRGEQRIADYVSAEDLQDRLDFIRQKGWANEEMDYFRSLYNAQGSRMFSDAFLDYLTGNELPAVEVSYDESVNDLTITAAGDWPLVTFWETIVMSEVSEAYFEGFVRENGIDIFELYAEGDRRLSEKIAYLQANPDVKISEFGTRRRFSLRWQKHVVERLRHECPENLVGTSNVALAQTGGLKPIGTFAHEKPMVYAGIADAKGEDVRTSHRQMLDDWYDFYGDELAVALSDTFGSDFFLSDFTLERAEKYRATRHDSGDPIAYGEKMIAHYERLGIDPLRKTILFSDNLKLNQNNNTVDAIHQQCKERIGHGFGIGTNLTNDLGLKALNMVMKATHVRLPETGQEADLVKLSDVPGKHTGPPEKIEKYKDAFSAREPTIARS